MAVPITTAMQTQIANLYISIMGRNPDPVGFGYWCDVYANANGTQAALDAIASGFGKSPEFTGIYSGQTVANAVALMYNNILGRTQDANGATYWQGVASNYITSGKTIGDAYALTANAMITAAAANTGTADATLIASKQATAVTAGITSPTTTYTLTTSAPETITATGTNNVINGTQTTLNANDVIIGSTSGTNTLSLVDTGTAAWSPTAASITNVQTVSLRNINGTAAVAAVTAVNEVQTLSVVGTIGGTTSVVSFLGVATPSIAAAAVASTVAAQIVTSKAAILAGTEAQALGLIDISAVAEVLTLTFNSAKGNVANVFSGVTGVGGVISFTAGVQTTQGVAGVPLVAAANFIDTVDGTKFGGATLFVNDVSTSQVDFTALTSTQAVRINGNGTTTNGATNATWTSATAATLTANGAVNGGAVALVGGLATVTVNSTGTATGTSATAALGANVLASLALGSSATALNINAANNIVFTNGITQFAGTTATITVTGAAGLVNLGVIANTTVKTVNAATFAGGITATLNTNVALAFTGGLGNDTVTTTAGVTLTTGTVDAGGGTGDILVLGADIGPTGDAAKFTNFDILRVVAGATQDVSLFSGITAVQMQSGANAITNLTAGQAAAMSARADITTLTAALRDGSATTDVFTLTLGTGLLATEATDTGVLTLTGFETINLATRAGVDAGTGALRVSTIAGFDAINANTINLTGTAFDITNIANQTGTRAKVLTVNGSALIGDGASTNVGLTLAGNIFAGSSVIGSTLANNVFTLGTQADTTYTGGNAKDSFTGSEAQITATTIVGGSGIDTLVIADGADTIANATFAKTTGMELLTLNEVAALDLTTGTAFNSAFTAGTVTITATALDASAVTVINTGTYSGAATLVVTTLADTETTTLTTGDGADTVTLTANATTAGLSTISTGAGVDTITANHTAGGLLITNATLAINAGAGADIITSNWGVNAAVALSNVIYTIVAGDSTLTAYDKITGFYKGAGATPLSDTLNFTGAAIKPADGFTAVTVVGYTAAQLQVAAATTGLLSFTGTLSSTLTNQMVIDAYISTIDSRIANLETVVWSSASSTLVFNNNTLGDSVVELVGVTGVVSVGAAAADANTVGIA